MLISEAELLDYLDGAITKWRNIRDLEIRDADLEEKAAMAPCYIDAFQSVRVSVFGKALP